MTVAEFMTGAEFTTGLGTVSEVMTRLRIRWAGA